jgi:alcohol dehydrogenase
MAGFQFSTVADIRVGAGAAQQLGVLCQQLGIAKPLIVTDPGLVQIGLVDPVRDGVARVCNEVSVFSQVTADPSESVVEAALHTLMTASADGVIGLGGGSSMDVAKVIAVLATGQQSLPELYGVDQVTSERLPLVLIPTTAGTGSEVTPVAVITTGATTKAGISSARLLPDVAVLDPQLTLGLPSDVSAMTGVDAMVHAIEAFTSKVKKKRHFGHVGKACTAVTGRSSKASVESSKRYGSPRSHAVRRDFGWTSLCECTRGGCSCAGLSFGRPLPHAAWTQ